MNKLGRGPLGQLHTKYQSCRPSTFREKKNLTFVFFVPMLQLLTPRAGPVLSLGHHMNELGRGPQGDATYKLSKL